MELVQWRKPGGAAEKGQRKLSRAKQQDFWKQKCVVSIIVVFCWFFGWNTAFSSYAIKSAAERKKALCVKFCFCWALLFWEGRVGGGGNHMLKEGLGPSALPGGGNLRECSSSTSVSMYLVNNGSIGREPHMRGSGWLFIIELTK